MGFRLLALPVLIACALCPPGTLSRASAQPAPAPPSAAVPVDPSPIIGVPVEPSSAPASAVQLDPSDPSPIIGVPLEPPAAATPAPVVPAQAEAQPPVTPQPATPPPPSAAARVAAHDPERPPSDSGSGDAGFSARLALGVGAALWIADGDLKLSKPITLGLDLGYAFNKRLALIARGSTWLRDGEMANEFFGAGAVYHFVADHLFVAGVLGLLFTRDGTIDQWTHRREGVALEIDVGQTFALSTHTEFAVGAHFQFGTPLGGKGSDALTSLHAGLFVSLGLR